MSTTPRRRAAFLDRDDTIIRDVDYLSSPGQLELLPGAPEALRMLDEAGFMLVIVTNQSVIARGMITIEQLDGIHEKLREMLREQDADVDAIYYCPHLPAGKVEEYSIMCECRKPSPGLLLRAAEELDIDLERSVMIGDSPRDVEAGKRAGCTTFLITGGRETGPMPDREQPDYRVDHLYAAARIAVSL